MVGRKSKRTAEGLKIPDGNWHFAVSASPQLIPHPRVVLRYHVIFTDDGETPWENADRMHRARRGVCRNWWNREWRDRLFAMCAALADGEDRLSLPVGDDVSIDMAMTPDVFISPWSYFEDGQTGVDETAEIELVEDASVEEDNEQDGSSEYDPGAEDD